MIAQKVIPVLKGMKDIEKINKYAVEYVVLMDIHIAQLFACCHQLKENGKKIIIHLDLIKGLSSDEYSVDYLIHELNVDGIISVKSSIVEKVKKLGKIAIQRMFLIDTQSYLKSIELIKNSNPDYIELLPGCIPKMIRRVRETLHIDVLAGGLIDSVQEVEEAIKSGASAITTSNQELIRHFCNLN